MKFIALAGTFCYCFLTSDAFAVKSGTVNFKFLNDNICDSKSFLNCLIRRERSNLHKTCNLPSFPSLHQHLHLSNVRASSSNYETPSGAEQELFQWATEIGVIISSKVNCGESSDGLRGLIASADIEPGEVLLDFPASGAYFSAEWVCSQNGGDGEFGIGTAARALEKADGARTPDDAILAAYLVLSRLHPRLSAFGAYAASLPSSPPDLPALWGGAAAPLGSLLPPDTAARAAAMRVDLAAVSAQALRLCALLPPPGAAPGAEELRWAWAMLRSRALREVVAAGAAPRATKICFPIADLMNHAVRRRRRPAAAAAAAAAPLPSPPPPPRSRYCRRRRPAAAAAAAAPLPPPRAQCGSTRSAPASEGERARGREPGLRSERRGPSGAGATRDAPDSARAGGEAGM
jgi:hypothetical protein